MCNGWGYNKWHWLMANGRLCNSIFMLDGKLPALFFLYWMWCLKKSLSVKYSVMTAEDSLFQHASWLLSLSRGDTVANDWQDIHWNFFQYVPYVPVILICTMKIMNLWNLYIYSLLCRLCHSFYEMKERKKE